MVAVSACTATSSGGQVATPSPTTATTVSRPPAAVTASRASLARYYHQHLSWTTCDGTFQCAQLLVPIDYADPHGATMHVAVIRKPATSTSDGSLVINPGGPGVSGVTFEADDAAAFSQLNEHFALVSFDPRGVGQSHPIRCVTAAQLTTYIDTNPVPTTRAEHATVVQQAKEIARDCYRRNGQYLEHVGTIDAARDMDVLRAALGDQKLTYFGGSYGTYLGAKYAQLFPTRIRAMVLDGAIDPALSQTQDDFAQAKGFQADLDDFLAACAASGSCPLGSTAAAAHATLESIRAKVTAHPLDVDGRNLGPGEFFEGLGAGLYTPTDWSALWTALAGVKDGMGSALLEFADGLTERNPDGSYSNLIESNLAIDCIDRPSPRKVSTYDAEAARFAKASPDFGAAIEYGMLPCAFWKVPPVERPHPVRAAGAPPILVIGTTGDPATPYANAQALAKQLQSGVLLTYEGDGHTAYLRHDPCVDAAVASYINDLRTPAPGTRCS